MRAIVLASLIASSLLASAGCNSHMHCVAYGQVTSYKNQCARYKQDHSCAYYRRNKVTSRECIQYACDKGYFKVRAKCVSEDPPEGKRRADASRRYWKRHRARNRENKRLIRAARARTKLLLVQLEKDCNARTLKACLRLARLYKGGKYARSSSRRPRRAMHAYTKACDLGHLDACHEAATLTWRLAGTNSPVGRVAFLKSCNKGSFKSCASLGHQWRVGSGGPKDKAKARVFYQKACDGGVKSVCCYTRLK